MEPSYTLISVTGRTVPVRSLFLYSNVCLRDDRCIKSSVGMGSLELFISDHESSIRQIAVPDWCLTSFSNNSLQNQVGVSQDSLLINTSWLLPEEFTTVAKDATKTFAFWYRWRWVPSSCVSHQCVTKIWWWKRLHLENLAERFFTRIHIEEYYFMETLFHIEEETKYFYK